MASYTREEREARKNYAKERSIVEVAESLGMELVKSGAEYRWKEHDSMVITPRTNLWHWFSQDKGGDTIELVRTINNISFNQAIDYLNDGDYSEGTLQHNDAPQAFKNYLAPYEQPFVEGRSYLKEVRGLSDETIDFFLDQNVITQANAKIGDTIEPVIVFKTIDHKGGMIGGNLQGIVENRERYDRHGYFKGIMRNSNGDNGLSVDIGRPERLIFAESPIDLMSYYELHKDQLENVRLVSMDGLKDGVIGTNLARLESEGRNVYMRDEDWDRDLLKKSVDDGYFNNGKHADIITLAVDNDQAGHNFIQSLEDKGVVVVADLPAEKDGFDKQDWNDALKEQKAAPKHPQDNSRLAQAERKLERLEQEESQEVAQNKVTSPEITQEPALQVLFDFSESREIAALYKNGQVIPYQEFVENLYRENDLPVFGGGYDKTFFSLIDEQGQELTRFRYDVGSETATISEQVSSVLTQDYLRLAEEADSRVTGRVGDTEKAPDQNQEPVGEERSMSMDNAEQEKKTPEITQEPSNAGEFHRTSDYLGEESPRTASQPVVDEPQPDFPVTAQLYFTTDRARVSNIKPGYRVARAKDMKDLNLFAPTLQSTAQWYLQELADSKIHYVFKDADGQFDKLEVNFQEKNFAHLAGISPVNRTMKETLYDFAEGRGDYPNIQVSKALRSKMKVLPLLPDIVDANSFVFNDLTNIEKLDNLDLSKAIAPEDNDLLVLFKDTAQDGLVPSSLMRVQGEFSQSLQEVERQTVLGVYRERDGKLEQLSINEELSQNDAQKMIDVVRNSLSVEKQKEITPEAFTGVLDAAYNVGRVPLDQVPEEYRAAWERFYELSDEVDGSLDRVVAKADEIGLLKKDTDFYKDWSSDKTYLNNYHVRLQLAEDHEKGAQLPFQKGQIIDYREFVTALYQENQALYDKIQDSAKVALETGEGYIPYTKTKFDVYAPGGRLIKDNVRYDVGDETQPVTRLMGLGARVLDGWEDLDRIDQEVLSQLEKQSPQEELAQGKSNSDPQTEEPYTSEKMAVKQGISDRVREIIAEGSARKTPEASKEDQRVNHSVTVETRLEEPQELDTRQENAPQTFPVEQELDGFSYQTAKAEELSAQAIKAIRSYAANPEDLKEYLDFMSHFTKYSPRNTALIHEQWRGANAVATYKQWEVLGKRMGIGPDDVLGGTNVEYTNDRTGKTKTIKNEGLSVRVGQKGRIKLFKPMMDEMIPVLDETGQQLKNDKGYPKYKPKKKATAAEEEAIKQGRLEVKSFPKRDLKTGKALYKTFTVFELSQTNLKPEKCPKIMPNRHYDFDTDKVKTQEVLLGLKDYADCLGVSIEKVDMMSNVKGQFNKEDQSIQLNDQNTKGEMVGTLIHELAHATLHNPKFKDCYKEEVPKEVKELEAEMTSYVTAKHFGLDTSEKAIPYMANWTDKLSKLSDDELDQSMKRVHETTKKMLKAVEKHTKPLAQRLSPEQGLSQHQNLNPLSPKM